MNKASKAPKPYKTPKIGVVRYIVLNVALPLLMVFIVIFIGLVVNGLYEDYINKKAEVRRFAKLLAHSAALENFDLVSELVSKSINQDSVLKDIHFYPIDNEIEFDDYVYDDWQNALLNPSVSFYEGVMVSLDQQTIFDDTITNESIPNATVNNATISNETINNKAANGVPRVLYDSSHHNHTVPSSSDQDANKALVGYINITIDLDVLRQHWFKRNLVVLIFLPAIALSLLILIYFKMRWPAKQVVEMSKKAKRIMAHDNLDLDPIIHSKKGFDELETIRLLMVKLDHRYKEVVLEFDAYKLNYEETNPQHQIKTQENNLRSMIIHGLKSSLNTVLDGLKLLDNQYVSKEQAEVVASIHKGSKELDFTLNQIILLDLIEKGLVGVSLNELQPAQLLNSLIQDYQSAATDKGLNLNIKLHHVDHVLAGDVQKIRSILGELLSNAIKYTNDGSISIDSRMDYFAETIRWTVKVKDTGEGIEQKYIEDIFVPFSGDNSNSNMSSDGIGLGVALRLTQLLGGDLSVVSGKGEGTTFSLVLQLKDWRYDEMHRMLIGINIAGLESANEGHYIENLETYGASVHTFLDSFALFEYIAVKPIDILLMAHTVSFEEVESLCLALRQKEESHRILIAWYGTNIKPSAQAMLEAVGLDYVLDPATSLKEQASVIKSWTMS